MEAPLDVKKKMAAQLLMQGSSGAPVQHWTQALARALQGGLGGYQMYQAGEEDKAAGDALVAAIPGLGGSPQPATPMATPQSSQPTPSTSFKASGQPSPEISKALAEAAAKYGVDPQYMTRAAGIESSYNQNAYNPKSKASGLFQFIPSTWGQYGNGASPFDVNANVDAAARLTRDNVNAFKTKFGRDPTPGEMYLLHQQGIGGGSALIANPNANVVEALMPSYKGNRTTAVAAVADNGGSPMQTAADFSRRWTSKFDVPQQGAAGSPGPTGAVGAALQPGRASPGIPPEQAAAIRGLIQNPATRQ